MFYNFQNVKLQRNVEPPARANVDLAGPLRALPCYVPFAPLLAYYTPRFSLLILPRVSPRALSNSGGPLRQNTFYHHHNCAPAVNVIDFRMGRYMKENTNPGYKCHCFLEAASIKSKASILHAGLLIFRKSVYKCSINLIEFARSNIKSCWWVIFLDVTQMFYHLTTYFKMSF